MAKHVCRKPCCILILVLLVLSSVRNSAELANGVWPRGHLARCLNTAI
jgi:hypothetical protein